MKRRWFAALIAPLLAAGLLAGLAHAAPAWSAPQVSDLQATYEFGQVITFTARLESDQPVKSATLFFQAQNDTRTTLGEAAIEAQPDGASRLRYIHSVGKYNLRAFSWVDYHWEITPQNGPVYRSPAARFYYRDNRFAWNSLEEKPFRVYWYAGDLQFAQDVLDAAQQGMIQVQNLIPLPMPAGLDLYIYADSKTMQAALHPNRADWIAGHADPDLGVITAALPSGPDQALLIQQRIPHELMHILLYQSTNLGYANLPTWLNEGLASLAELYPNSDYQILLEDATQRDALIALPALCGPFPRDASGALLSYAESASFVKYLHSAYGTSGLQTLLTTYANGLDCERGAQRALGRSLTQLDRDWRRDALAQNTTAAAVNNLLPWLILLGAALAAPLALALRRWRAPK